MKDKETKTLSMDYHSPRGMKERGNNSHYPTNGEYYEYYLSFSPDSKNMGEDNLSNGLNGNVGVFDDKNNYFKHYISNNSPIINSSIENLRMVCYFSLIFQYFVYIYMISKEVNQKIRLSFVR